MSDVDLTNYFAAEGAAVARELYQTPKTRKPDRTDHVWVRRVEGGFKCVLCGGVTNEEPPMSPTPKGWMPDHYELPLTPEERAQAPFRGSASEY